MLTDILDFLLSLMCLLTFSAFLYSLLSYILDFILLLNIVILVYFCLFLYSETLDLFLCASSYMVKGHYVCM